jgi:tetratricopeptide (TPR) repeat protein
MSGSLYEGYKEALRRGHVAALRGRLDVAMAAYREASRIAPDRALPYVGLGGVLARLERVDEALAAYRVALERAPDDEGALRGRADLLVSIGRAAEAATTLDRLARALETAGRLADACDVARRALELAESRGRRGLVQSLVAGLRENAGDPSVAEALERALGVLEDAPSPMPDGDGVGAEPSGPATAERSEAGTSAETAPAAEPETPAVRLAPPPDPVALSLAYEAAFDAGKLDEARKGAVASASAYRTLGQFHAAVDACYEALAIAPADPGVHFALAQLYLDRGWRSLAADKLLLIGRLAQLTGDTASQARLRDLVVRRFPDDARLVAVSA